MMEKKNEVKRIFQIKYGETTIPVEIPQENVLSFIEVPDLNVQGENREKIQQAIAHPIGMPLLPAIVRRKYVVILMADATREIPQMDILRELVPQLKDARFLHVLICTGTHQPELPGNKEIVAQIESIFNTQKFSDFKITIHNSYGKQFTNYGRTSFGNTILINPILDKAEAFIAISDMKHHYFAGYSNVLKSFMPGAAAFRTVEQNHAMALLEMSTFGRHPWHPDPQRRDNPLAKEMLEAFRLIVKNKPVWTVVTITKKNRILWCAAGDPEQVTRSGIKRVDEWMSRTVTPADVLIVSPGGYPNDESLYTAQRALELNWAAVKPGGRILFFSQCRNGIGPPVSLKNFYNLLAQDLETVLKLRKKDYVLYMHKAYKFARMIKNLSFLGMKSELPKEAVKKIHLTPLDNPQTLIELWLKKEPNLTFNIVNDGNKISLYRGNSRSI